MRYRECLSVAAMSLGALPALAQADNFAPPQQSNHALIITVSEYQKSPLPGVLTDRKGRPVPVERFGQAPAREPLPSEERKGGRRGRRSASDRGSGPRPRHPRSR